MRYHGRSPKCPACLQRIGVFVVLAAVAACRPSGGTHAGPPVTRGPVSDSMAQFASISSRTADSASVRAQPNCNVPLTGLLHTSGPDRRWLVPWSAIEAHVATLDVEAERGETNHVLRPLEKNDTVRASIASIKGTETLSEEESLQALRCGRIIARVISDGDHQPTEIAEGTNYLVIALTQPMTVANPKWVFVILNRSKNYRASLNTFKFTPHVTGYATPVFTGSGRTVRAVTRMRPLSAAAEGCLARGWKACFIDAPHESRDGDGGSSGIGGMFLIQGGSQPWVPCPLYGCCCGGDACHTAFQ